MLDGMNAGRLRAARPDDAEAVARLHVAAWQAAYLGLLPDSLLDGLDVDERIARRRAALSEPWSPEVRNWVIESGDVLEGWAATGPSRDEDLGEDAHELYAIYLQPCCVGRGLGRELMRHCLQDAADRGFSELVLWVLRGNARADAFYRAAGFVADDRVPSKPFRDTGVRQVRLRQAL